MDLQVSLRLFNVASTQIGSEVLHREMSEASTPLIKIQAQAACPLNHQCPSSSRIKTLRTYHPWLQGIMNHLHWMVAQ